MAVPSADPAAPTPPVVRRVTVGDLVAAMERLAPPAYAETWDNVGLLVGDRAAPVTQTLLTIDFTEDVWREAVAAKADAVIAYHPLMFKPVQRLTGETAHGRVLLGAIRTGMAVYSPHTALDAAPDGMTDWLADAVGQGYRRPLAPHESLPASRAVKIVTFAPLDAVDRLRDALASVGAGHIGAYELCSFSVTGTGTFRGGATTRPAVGQAGVLERVEEARLEMVCPAAALHLVVAALRQFHPYEEPAFDLYPLRPAPLPNVGAGRRVVLDHPASVDEIAARVKAHLGIGFVVSTDPRRMAHNVAVVPGAGATLLEVALAQDCDLFITGEVTHHQALAAFSRGCSLILTGHTNSERGYLPILARRLVELLPSVEFRVSRVDRSLFEVA